MRSPAPGVLWAHLSGHVTDDLAAPYIATLQQTASDRSDFLLFADVELLENYQPGFRVRTTQAHQQLRDRTQAIHILFRSKAVAFAVQVANVLIRRIVAYSGRESFEAALAKAVAERARRGSTAA